MRMSTRTTATVCRASGINRCMAATLPSAVVSALVVFLAACAPGAPESGPTGPAGDRITLAWTAPSTDAEGAPLGDLAGYRVYYASESPVTREAAERVEVGDTTRHTLSGLEPGVYFLAVAAVDTAGNESELSEEIRAELGEP